MCNTQLFSAWQSYKNSCMTIIYVFTFQADKEHINE
jgi:hypothetical protein